MTDRGTRQKELSRSGSKATLSGQREKYIQLPTIDGI